MPQEMTTRGPGAAAPWPPGSGAPPPPVPSIALVLGMPGSGLRLCAQVMRLLGFDIVEAGDGADGGLGALHDSILALFERPFATAYHDFQLPPGWWADPRLRPLRRDVSDLLRQRLADGAPLGLQDPRIAKLLPLWHSVLRPLGLGAKVVLCLRNPARLAGSPATSGGIDPAIVEHRWFVYVCDVFRQLRDCGIGIVDFETWFADPDSNLRRLTGLFEFEGEADGDLRDAVAGVVDPRLPRRGDAAAAPRHPFVRSFYQLVRGFGEAAAGREHIDYIVDQFVTFRQLHRPFESEFEALARAGPETRTPAPATDEIEALRQLLAARDAGLAGLRERADQLEQQLQQVTAERSQANAALARALLRSEQHDAVAEELYGLRDQLAAREASLAELGRQLQTASATAEAASAALQQTRQAAESEAVGLRETLAARDQELRQAIARADEIAGRVQPAQAEAAALRDALAAREHELQQAIAHAEEIAGRLEAALAEAVDLREALASRDGQLQQARAHAEDLAGRLLAAEGEAAAGAEAATQLQRALAQRSDADAALAGVQQQAALDNAAARSAAAEAAQLRDALAHANQRAEAAERQQLEAEPLVEGLRAQLAQARAEAATLRTALAVGGDASETPAEADAAGLRGWLSAAREEIATLRQELAAAQPGPGSAAAAAAATAGAQPPPAAAVAE